ncbi:hypothetical protein HOK51_10565 [Candidatus Woesearchaeota archaeon]|jgi:HTH-type transcriptional regulator, sugar sensing transcriptional regulator|nr:hypothetical protein [Candidatus Woesearchaeota archaeon]MBT6520265.1 hypothetical protein [Candidatus Woesearchaeota archaeon]MBT7368811.1 hypothetical protein [Candidatus Woesearchaeota archaeon]
MDKYKEKLRFLGLTNNEVDVYITLLKNPKSTGALIKRSTSISNSRVYSSLDTLIGKGLVTYERISTGRLFSAVNPEMLNQLVNDRKQEINKLVPELQSLQNFKEISTKTEVYEGLNGFNTALNKFLECKDKSKIDILAFSNIAYKGNKLINLLKRINHKLILKKMKIRVLADHDSPIRNMPHYQKNTSVKYMPKGYVSPSAIDICEDKICIFIWGDKPYAFFIQNQEVADGFKSYFNFLWSIAKK